MLMGHPRDLVAESTRVSAGSVTNHWKIFKRRAYDLEIDGAAMEFGVDAEINNLRALGSELLKTGLTAPQSYEGARILAKIRKLDVDEKILDKFLTGFIKKSEVTGVKPGDLVKYSLELFNLEKEKNLDYNSLIKSIDERRKELDTLNIRIKNINKETKTAENKLKQALSELNITLETLNEYNTVRNTLTTYGIDMIETHRLANMMKNSKELGYNPTRIIIHITKNESLSEHQTKLQQVIDNLKEKEHSLRQQHEKLSAEIHTLTNQKEALKASINTLTEKSLNQIKQIWDTAQEKLEKISKEETKIITQHLSETKKTLAFVKKERDKSFVHINAMVEETETSIKVIRDLASETGREIGKLEAISPILHLIEGSEGQPHEIYSAMTIISQQFKSWLNKNTTDSYLFRMSLDSLINDLNSAMRR